MKKVLVLLVLCVGGTLNVSAQAKKDTVFVGDSVAFVKIQEGKKFFAIYKGTKIRAAKKDSGKKCYVIYNINTAGERKISKMYYAN